MEPLRKSDKDASRKLTSFRLNSTRRVVALAEARPLGFDASDRNLAPAVHLEPELEK